MQSSTGAYRDANHVPILTDGLITKKTITFAGATTDAWGNDGGALDGGALFTVTGLVFCKLIAVCETGNDLTGANATVSVGIGGATTIFLPVETATQIDGGQLWANDAANGTSLIVGAEGAAAGNLPEWALMGTNIILTVATANVTGGKLDFYCIWRPISATGNVADSGL